MPDKKKTTVTWLDERPASANVVILVQRMIDQGLLRDGARIDAHDLARMSKLPVETVISDDTKLLSVLNITLN